MGFNSADYLHVHVEAKKLAFAQELLSGVPDAGNNQRRSTFTYTYILIYILIYNSNNKIGNVLLINNDLNSFINKHQHHNIHTTSKNYSL